MLSQYGKEANKVKLAKDDVDRIKSQQKGKR